MINTVSRIFVIPDGLLDEIKRDLIIEDDTQDDRLNDSIKRAARIVERETGRSFSAMTYDLTFTHFPARIFLPYPPLDSVTWIKYYDTQNVQQILDPSQYYVTKGNTHSVISPASCWPVTYSIITPPFHNLAYWSGAEYYYHRDIRDDAVTVRFVTASAIDVDFNAAVSTLVGHWDRNREGQEIPAGFDRLMYNLKAWRGVIA